MVHATDLLGNVKLTQSIYCKREILEDLANQRKREGDIVFCCEEGEKVGGDFHTLAPVFSVVRNIFLMTFSCLSSSLVSDGATLHLTLEGVQAEDLVKLLDSVCNRKDLNCSSEESGRMKALLKMLGVTQDMFTLHETEILEEVTKVGGKRKITFVEDLEDAKKTRLSLEIDSNVNGGEDYSEDPTADDEDAVKVFNLATKDPEIETEDEELSEASEHPDIGTQIKNNLVETVNVNDRNTKVSVDKEMSNASSISNSNDDVEQEKYINISEDVKEDSTIKEKFNNSLQSPQISAEIKPDNVDDDNDEEQSSVTNEVLNDQSNLEEEVENPCISKIVCPMPHCITDKMFESRTSLLNHVAVTHFAEQMLVVHPYIKAGVKILRGEKRSGEVEKEAKMK